MKQKYTTRVILSSSRLSEKFDVTPPLYEIGSHFFALLQLQKRILEGDHPVSISLICEAVDEHGNARIRFQNWLRLALQGIIVSPASDGKMGLILENR